MTYQVDQFTFKTGLVYDFAQNIEVRQIDNTIYFRDTSRKMNGKIVLDDLDIEFIQDDFDTFGSLYVKNEMQQTVLYKYDRGLYEWVSTPEINEII